MPSNPRSNPLALAVLGCLYERPMHPYEVAQTLRQRAVHESIKLNYGSLYSVVESLDKRGFIRAAETVKEGRRPERTIYEITPEGGREFVDWLSALITTPVKEYLQFEAALALLAAFPPQEAASLLRTRIGELEGQLTLGRSIINGVRSTGLPRLFVIESEYMLALAEAELEYVRGLVKDIEDGTLEGVDAWRAFHAGRDESPDESRAPPESEEP